MGYFMKEHDIYVGSLQEKLNLRFAPSLGTKELHGGLDEMVELQKEFGKHIQIMPGSGITSKNAVSILRDTMRTFHEDFFIRS